MSRHPFILSTGSYVPERVVTNEEVDALMGAETAAWLVANVGIRERRWMADDQVTSDLIVQAANRALERAGISAGELGLIIVSTDTPDYLSPSTSVVVQYKLGAENAGCYDVNSACAGWVTALDQGARYLMTEPGCKYVLVAGGYGMSRFLDLKDKKTANLFADGAGAVVLAGGHDGARKVARGAGLQAGGGGGSGQLLHHVGRVLEAQQTGYIGGAGVGGQPEIRQLQHDDSPGFLLRETAAGQQFALVAVGR